MSTLLVATTNAGKLAELGRALGQLGVRVVGLGDVGPFPEAVEDRDTFAGNARAKAEHYARLSGLDVLADDSGLEVAALDGAPGVFSARFAGPDADDAANNALLLERLGEVSGSARAARFVCALCLLRAASLDDLAVPAGEPSGLLGERGALEVSGHCEGRLLDAPRGDGGFGYDPLFVPDAGDGRSFAQMSKAEKQDISHRGHAVAALLVALEGFGERAAEEAAW